MAFIFFELKKKSKGLIIGISILFSKQFIDYCRILINNYTMYISIFDTKKSILLISILKIIDNS